MHLLIPAAGRGSRMGAPVNKLLLPLAGRPILAWTLLAASVARSIEWIGIVGQPEDRTAIDALLADLGLAVKLAWIDGGTTRQESVFRGLAALPGRVERVLVHDGARCLATPDLFDRCAAALAECPALVAAVPVKDTIKQVATEGRTVEATVPRERLWAAQTPQGFAVAPLVEAHRLAAEAGLAVTDDAALCEWRGIPVTIVPGEETNLKVTTPADLLVAGAILAARHNEGSFERHS